MEMQILLDKLSEFLMVEQGGLQLYKVAQGRAIDAELKRLYGQFAEQTSHHREVLIRLITAVGGDPSYISPTARIAQHKAESLLCCALQAGPLTPEEVQANDLENLVLAETKDHADWQLLSKIAQQMPADEPSAQLFTEAVQEVEAEEDQHIEMVKQKLEELQMRMLANGKAVPLRDMINNETLIIKDQHPKPITAGLLEFSEISPWLPSPAVRETSAV